MSQTQPHHLAAEFGIEASTVIDAIVFLFGEPSRRTESIELTQEQADQIRGYLFNFYGPQASAGAHIYNNAQPLETGFARLTLRDWRQFEFIDIDLSSRLTIITGENGTGKTSLLALLGQAFNEQSLFVGTPLRDKDGFYFQHGKGRPKNPGQFEIFGQIVFESGGSAHLGVRDWNQPSQPSFVPELLPQKTVAGLYLDAQRVLGPYQAVDSIPARFNSASEIALQYRQQLKNLFVPHSMIKSPGLLIKEALIAAALYGEGNAAVVADPRAAEVWIGFQSILDRILPPSLEFKDLMVDQGEVILRTKSGDFALEAASGGVAALLSLAWQIYLASLESDRTFTVCFDEPENHLHPALQRTILPSLLEAFPSIRFVVATHSPFVVTASQDASVYALRRNETGRVYSEHLDLAKQAFSADEILDDVLGVGSTIPIWAERRIANILLESSIDPTDGASVKAFFAKLDDAGLGLLMPNVASIISENARKVDGERGQKS